MAVINYLGHNHSACNCLPDILQNIICLQLISTILTSLQQMTLQSISLLWPGNELQLEAGFQK